MLHFTVQKLYTLPHFQMIIVLTIECSPFDVIFVWSTVLYIYIVYETKNDSLLCRDTIYV